MLNKLIISFIISSFCFNVFAKSPTEAIINSKFLPPIINYYPFGDFSFDNSKIKWNSSSNLRRKTGSAFTAIGEVLIFEGYIFDIDNIPIDGVEIRMMQANANGVYNFEYSPQDALYDNNFSDNGISITDNRGYFRFVTVFPGSYNKRAPHLHILVNYKNYVVVETEVFFQNHPRNKMDYKYQQLTKQEKINLTAEMFFINSKEKSQGKIARLDMFLNINQDTKEL